MSASAKDPAVGLLIDPLSLDPPHDFLTAPPMSGELGQFSYRLKGHAADFEPTVYFATIEAARAVLEPMLLLWHVSALPQFGPAGFDFFFVRGVVDESSEKQDERRRAPMFSPPMPP